MPDTIPWVAITLDDVKSCALAELLDLSFTRATNAGQTDPFTLHLPKTVARVRSKVASNPRNRLSADPTLVPPELADQTATLVAYKIALPTATSRPALLDTLKEAIRSVEKDLDAVAAGNYAVSLPPDAEAPGTGVAPTTGTIAVVTGNCRQATREGMRGL